MSKAPAFQFYYDRFNSATSLWDDAQVGKYIRLMICQANKGYVSAKELKKLVPDGDTDILDKFEEVEPGKYINRVLEGVLISRDNYMKKQSENGAKGGRPKNPDETQIEPRDNPNDNPDETSTSTSLPTSTITTIPNSDPTKKNKAGADDFFSFDRDQVINELNELTGRKFEADAAYVKKHLNPRLKEYSVTDLIDMVRFMVFKRKGTDLEQWLRPETLFGSEKCASYMVDMKHHRENGITPKKDNSKKVINEGLGERVAALYRARAERERGDQMRAANAQEG